MSKIWALVLAVILLNVWDVVNTLHIISDPSEELNPVMGFFLEQSIMMFVIAKMFLIIFGSVVLAKHRPHYLPYVVVLYTCIILYQLFVIFYLTGF